MGGADRLLAQARASFDKGEYRWVAQVVNNLVFADPDNQEARALQADALEQLGYQAESGPWRNFYLSAAKELRDGVIPRWLAILTWAVGVMLWLRDLFWGFQLIFPIWVFVVSVYILSASRNERSVS